MIIEVASPARLNDLAGEKQTIRLSSIPSSAAIEREPSPS